MTTFRDLIERPRWMNDAACVGTDVETFFPERGGVTSTAKAIGGGCPVRAHCLAYALTNNERHGIWGGTSERQRRRMRQARAAA